MASMTASRLCVKCEKNVGTFICEGCKEIFCTKHSMEHRQELSIKFENLMSEHNLILQQMHDKEQQKESAKKDMLCQIDQWENYMIEKVREKTAQVRQRLFHLMDNEKELVIDGFQDVKNELYKRHETEDFFEHDLERLKQNIDQIKQETDKSIQRPEIELYVESSYKINWSRLIYIKEKSVKISSSVAKEKVNHSNNRQASNNINSSRQRIPTQQTASSDYKIDPRGIQCTFPIYSPQSCLPFTTPPRYQNYVNSYPNFPSYGGLDSVVPSPQMPPQFFPSQILRTRPSGSTAHHYTTSTSKPGERQRKPLCIIDPVSHKAIEVVIESPSADANHLSSPTTSINDTTSSSSTISTEETNKTQLQADFRKKIAALLTDRSKK